MLTALVTEYPSSPRRRGGPCNVCPWREPQRFHLQQSQLPLGEETSKTYRSHFSSRLLLKTDKSASSKRAESLNLGGVSRRRCCDFRFVTPLNGEMTSTSVIHRRKSQKRHPHPRAPAADNGANARLARPPQPCPGPVCVFGHSGVCWMRVVETRIGWRRLVLCPLFRFQGSG